MPICGFRVVNGYEATLGLALGTALSNDDLPALGKPISPISAIVLSSAMYQEREVILT